MSLGLFRNPCRCRGHSVLYLYLVVTKDTMYWERGSKSLSAGVESVSFLYSLPQGSAGVSLNSWSSILGMKVQLDSVQPRHDFCHVYVVWDDTVDGVTVLYEDLILTLHSWRTV